jgi:hypothetical protein
MEHKVVRPKREKCAEKRPAVSFTTARNALEDPQLDLFYLFQIRRKRGSVRSSPLTRRKRVNVGWLVSRNPAFEQRFLPSKVSR